MSYLKNNLKKKLLKFSESKPSPIFILGSAENLFLTAHCDQVHSLSKRILQKVNILKKTASTLSLSSLSANQIFSLESIFILNKSAKKWFLPNQTPSDYEVFINPHMTHTKKLVDKDSELCASLPFLRSFPYRFKEIRVNYYTEQFEQTTQVLSGFKARMFQHELDHLKGFTFLDWRVCLGEIEIINEAKNDYLNFEKALVKYRALVQEIRKNFPEILDFYQDEKNYGEVEEIEGEQWYKYDQKAFRGQQAWSKEGEVLRSLQRAAEMDFNITIVILHIRTFFSFKNL